MVESVVTVCYKKIDYWVCYYHEKWTAKKGDTLLGSRDDVRLRWLKKKEKKQIRLWQCLNYVIGSEQNSKAVLTNVFSQSGVNKC